MYNPYEEFERNEEPLSDKIRNQLLQEKAQSERTIIDVQAAEQQAAAPAAGKPGTPGQQQPSQSTNKQANPEDEPKDAGDYARDVAEGVLAVPTGTVDWAVDLYNVLPSPDLPKIPKFKGELQQAAREISSFIVPTILLTKGLGAAGKAAQAKVAWEAGKKSLVKFMGEAGIAAGAGAFVDATNKLNESDDNLQGSLKKMFPKTFSWISDDWATLDTDAPDVKRAKNINEGVGLGIFTDLLVGAGKLLRAVKGTKDATRWIPENEQAAKAFEKIKNGTTTVEEEVLTAAAMRETAVDELGEYRIGKNPDLNEPLFGIHDVFDVEESGIRSVDDMGVIGASVDQARIANNLGTQYGRLGSIITEAALKKGLGAESLTRRDIIKGVVDQIKSSGKYSYLLDNKNKITFEQIDKAGTDLAQYLLDPRMDAGMLKGTLDNFMNEVDGMKNLTDTGYNAAMKAIKGYMDEYINMDTLKAQAYLTTSLAGQVSDIAEGARYMDGTAAIERAQEQILDRIEYLMVEKGIASYIRGAGLNNIKVWQRMRYAGDATKMKEVAENARAQTDDALAQIIPRAKNTAETLRTISKERPEYLVPLQMAWEFTDGSIDTVSKLNKFVENSLADIHKGFMDGTPEIPNVLVQGMWSNIYNSVLTSISTPLKAGFANTALLLEKPITVLGGAMLGGDLKTLKRGWYQYSAFIDTMNKGLRHMSDVYRKAASDPTSVGYIMRDDIVQKNEGTMDVLHSFARAAEQRGEMGPLALYYKAEALNDLANNPWLRFGANAMTALDGFARAVIANAEVRGRIYDKFIDGGRKLDGDGIRKALDEQYSEMFDSTGMITDKAVDYSSREIAMNLDGPAVTALSSFITRFPAIKPFLMFPRTSANIIAMANKHSPISIFANDYNKLAMPGKNFTVDEVVEILTSKGLPIDENIEQTFNTLRAEIRGRKAVGTITMMAAAGMFLNGNLRGNGHHDKERQKVRQELGWKPRTYKGWDGKWYSYEAMGPIADFLALTADVMDNFDTVTEDDLATTINKLGFLLSANLTNKSMLAGIEPMNDVLSGNPAAINRWAASFASSLAPLSGARNELGRLLAPQLREVDMEFTQLLRNRNKFTDVIDPNSALPDAHDWIDGKKIGYPENFFVRAFNAVSPMKVSDDLSPERQFLVDIEYDSRPSFMKNQKGIRYTPQERSELYSLIGKQGYFKKELQRIMQSTDAKTWKDSLQTARGNGSQTDPALWQNLYKQINVALDRSKRLAEVQLSNRDDVMRRQYQQLYSAEMQKRGVALPILENK
jgi:hypothetical protein